MMPADSPVAILNELLTLEWHGLPRRLIESGAFVSPTAKSDYNHLLVMAKKAREHAGVLADLIQNLGGVPQSGLPPTDSAGYHFSELSHLRPLLLSEQKNIVEEYTAAGRRLSNVPRAAAVVAAILEDHRRTLEELSAQKNARG